MLPISMSLPLNHPGSNIALFMQNYKLQLIGTKRRSQICAHYQNFDKKCVVEMDLEQTVRTNKRRIERRLLASNTLKNRQPITIASSTSCVEKWTFSAIFLEFCHFFELSENYPHFPPLIVPPTTYPCFSLYH